MITFTKLQNDTHRKSFIESCRQNAWNTACHADHLEGQIAERIVEYRNCSQKYADIKAEIDKLAAAIDAHTFDNRQKRKQLQAELNGAGSQMERLIKIAEEGRAAVAQMRAQAAQYDALAKHAESFNFGSPTPPQAAATHSPEGENVEADQ